MTIAKGEAEVSIPPIGGRHAQANIPMFPLKGEVVGNRYSDRVWKSTAQLEKTSRAYARGASSRSRAATQIHFVPRIGREATVPFIDRQAELRIENQAGRSPESCA